MDIGNTFQNIRKAEAMFLPLLPARWRETPPSYRACLPVLIWFAKRKKRFRWAEPALNDFENQYLAAFHKKGFDTRELTPRDTTWLQAILSIALLVTLIGFLPLATHLSFPIKIGLLLGAAALLVRASMEFGPGPFLAAWTLAFHCAIMLAPTSSYFAPRILSFCGLIWTAAVVRSRPRWRLIDVIGTTPILSFWYMAIEKRYLPDHPLWHSGIIALGLWAAIWALLILPRTPRILNSSLQFVWTASLLILGLTGPIATFLKVPALPVCLSGMMISCGIMAYFAQRLKQFPTLFRARTITAVFAGLALFILFSAKDGDKAGWSDTAIDYASGWLWPVWWIAGAGLVVAAYKLSRQILNWLFDVFPLWLLPSVLWIIVILEWDFGRLAQFENMAGHVPALLIGMSFAGGATYLAFKRRKRALRYWLFCGLFAFFIFDSYWTMATDLVNYKTQAAANDQGRAGYLLLTIWLMGLALVAAHSWRAWVRDSPAARRGIVLIAGAFLWFLIAQLWSTQVDRFTDLGGHVPLRQRINLELLHGATFLGIVLLVREVIREHQKNWSLTSLPWGAILLCGILVPQLLQGVEHWNYAQTHNISFNALQMALHQAASVSLNQPVPNLVISPAWRVLRWLISAAIIAALLLRRRGDAFNLRDFLLTALFTSLAVATAEAMWIDWPGVSNEWSPLLRPWFVTATVWNLHFLAQYIAYAAAGSLLGAVIWLFHPGPNPAPH